MRNTLLRSWLSCNWHICDCAASDRSALDVFWRASIRRMNVNALKRKSQQSLNVGPSPGIACRFSQFGSLARLVSKDE
jgi:hypothetical protein